MEDSSKHQSPIPISQMTQPKKTRWGCLMIPMAITLFFAASVLHEMWYDSLPVDVHLRDVFKQSGFSMPEYVTDLAGSKGFVDFHDDYEASLSFSVRSEDLEKFMNLSSSWTNASDFKPCSQSVRFGAIEVPVGSFVIEQWKSPSYWRKYAVNKKLNRVYFYRSST